jgi:hypothetical protein
MAYTTIQITKETREKLSSFKANERNTYDEILSMLMNLVPSGDDEGEYTDEFRASLFRSLIDLKGGRTYTMQEIKKMTGVK